MEHRATTEMQSVWSSPMPIASPHCLSLCTFGELFSPVLSHSQPHLQLCHIVQDSMQQQKVVTTPASPWEKTKLDAEPSRLVLNVV